MLLLCLEDANKRESKRNTLTEEGKRESKNNSNSRGSIGFNYSTSIVIADGLTSLEMKSDMQHTPTLTVVIFS
jgi:hypothetical protein